MVDRQLPQQALRGWTVCALTQHDVGWVRPHPAVAKPVLVTPLASCSYASVVSPPPQP